MLEKKYESKEVEKDKYKKWKKDILKAEIKLKSHLQ